MEQINYSFIIPHHNTPDLLQRLVDSIPQRDDIEIIIVDDNSEEEKKPHISRCDANIVYLDKSNALGAGRARNVGLDLAKGKWLLFADSDDFYLKGFMDVLDRYLDSDFDFIFFDIISVDSKTLKADSLNRSYRNNTLIGNYDGSKNKRDELLFLSWSPWNKMIRHNFVKKYNFRYEEIPNGNDVFFSFQLGYFADKIHVIKQPLYALTYFENSITYKKKSFQNLLTTFLNMLKRSRFFEFIGYACWDKMNYFQEPRHNNIRFLLRTIKRQPVLGMKLLFYVIMNPCSIKQTSMYYVREIERIIKTTKS